MLPAHDVAGPDSTDGYAQRQHVADALATLPARMRAVLVLRYFEDLSEAATAEALGISLATVKSQAARGLTRLRAQLGTPSPATAEGGALR